MKKKAKIIFELDCDYPDLKETKKANKDFYNWLKNVAIDTAARGLIPVLYRGSQIYGGIGYEAEDKIKIKIVRGKDVIYEKLGTSKFFSKLLDLGKQDLMNKIDYNRL